MSRFFIFIAFTLASVHKSQAFSECSNNQNVSDPDIAGVSNCLSWTAYLQSQSVNIQQWCAMTANFNKCCMTCQNYQNLVSGDCFDIAFSGDCAAKKNQGMCKAALADARLVQFYCQKTCGVCVQSSSSILSSSTQTLSCSGLVSPCQGGGTCKQVSYFGINAIQCVCPYGTMGAYCDQINSCQLFPCKNGGTCTLATNEPGGYTCSCSWSYTGSKCETYVNSNTVTSSNAVTKSSMVTSSNTVIVIDNVSSCAIYRCNNGGSCFTDINGQAFCQCAQGWTGKYCSKFIGPCISFPCQNGGTCAPTNSGFYCLCQSGYNGKTCQFIKSSDPCTSAPCLNGGSCLSMSVTSFTCKCPISYYGIRCETLSVAMPTNACSSPNPCLNGGVCNLKGDGSYYCICPNGFTGSNCELNNPCSSQPCLNGGSCVIYGSSNYSCQCPNGFTGLQCQMLIQSANGCTTSSQCMSGGSCINQRCFCQFGYTGTRCETKLTCSAANSPCLNGGTCVLNINNATTCVCRANTYGNYCEFAVTAQLCQSGDRDTVKCKQWYSFGLCTFANSYSTMPLPFYCPQSCNLCATGLATPVVLANSLQNSIPAQHSADCVDSQTSCLLWAAMGLCNRVNQNDPKLCAKSCGRCN